jgi:hypothetical protein
VRPRLNFLIAIGELGISANAVLQLQQQTSSSVHNLDKLFQADSIARPVASVAAGLQCQHQHYWYSAVLRIPRRRANRSSLDQLSKVGSARAQLCS